MLTNEQKLNEAQNLVLEVWEALVPDRPVLDIYYLQIGMTADRLIADLQKMRRFAEEFNTSNSPDPDFG